MKTIWIIIAVVIIAIVGFIALSNDSEPDVTNSTNSQDSTSTDSSLADEATPTVVSYSGSGFSPSSVTIKEGELVTFRNESDDEMWVASNPHPIHTALGGFDAGKNYSKGESYTFMFTRKGSWGYHNHSNSDDTGTVVVQ